MTDFHRRLAPFVLLLCSFTTVWADEPEVAAGTADAALRTALVKALSARGAAHEPRTEHLFDDGSPRFLNRLIKEDSPYLLQHAHNPVNWYPWGDEAFTAAREQDKPVFLSIGYATCHWCHVMERESFENLEIAERMNRDFISIKVDREQLPDIDAFYMTGVQLVSGRGGWPMSSFTDIDGRPFYGGTYFPPADFTVLLEQVDTLWKSERETLDEQAESLAGAIAESNGIGREAREIGETTIEQARRGFLLDVDALEGGFGAAPKFPREPTHAFLLDQAQRNGDKAALTAVDEALEAMAAGGIHDHVGGGFHRYAVDTGWQVPHFEKMLYNQAAMARLYAEAWVLTGKEVHARTARRTLDYVLREMMSSEDMFYSATDADSEGEEGRFFVWRPEQLDELLGKADAKQAKAIWGLSENGNFEGFNILHTVAPLAEHAREHDMTSSELMAKLDAWSEVLRPSRETREPPLRDEKILTAWNAMMVTALAEASEQLGVPEYESAAVRTADALWSTMLADPDTTALYRTRFEGRSSVDATQLDYAYLAEAMLALHDVTDQPRWLIRATSLADAMVDRFRDPIDGGFFMGAATVKGATLAARPKSLQDSSIASGNSVAMRVFARLARRTGEPRFGDEADALITALSSSLEQYPTSYPYFLTGVSEHLLGESGARRHAARGKVVASASASASDGSGAGAGTRAEAVASTDADADGGEGAGTDDARLQVQLRVAEGWHVNAHVPLQDYLIPTTLTGADGIVLEDVSYPEPEIRTLGFQSEALALHEGTLVMTATFSTEGVADRRRIPIDLRLQACSDEICLAPETVRLQVALR